MKFKPGLLITTLLLLPGWAAALYGIVTEGRGGKGILAFKEQNLYILICLTILGIVVGLNVPRGMNSNQKILRTTILFFGVLSLLVLSFPLM